MTSEKQGWIEHDGKTVPVSYSTEVLVKFRDGYVEHGDLDGASTARYWGSEDAKRSSNWHHTGGGSDIIAYRVVQL